MAFAVALLLTLAVFVGLMMLRTRRIAAQAEAAVPRAGRYTPVNDGGIHWVEDGEGPPILMLHGLGGTLGHFTYGVTPLLKDRYRCIAIDRPGCGWSERDADDFAHLTHQARMIVEFMKREGISRPLVVGHSLGGALALVLALRHPEEISGLALIAPLAYPQPEIPPVFRGLAVRGPLMRRIIGATVAVPMAVRMAPRTLAAIFAPEPAPEDFALRAGGLLGLRPKGFVAPSADLTVNSDLREISEDWGSITAPGGVLYGAADAILDPEAQGAALVAQVPRLSLDLLEGRGHMLPITAPRETAEFIARMADRAGLARAA